MSTRKVWHPYFVRLVHTSTLLRSVELSKEWQRVSDCWKSVTLSLLCQTIPHFWELSKGFMTMGKVWYYPNFVRLFHTSKPLRSVELSKEWQRVHDWGESATISLLCQTIPHFHTSEKCGTKERMTSSSWLGGKCDSILTLSDYSTLPHFSEV